jgi:F0F1-type ATP synthase assembly protein I
MKKAAAHPTTKSPSDDNPFALGVVASDFLDTTWRIAVPVVLAAAMGILADKQFGTKPWLTLLLTAAGFGVAALLVKRQLAMVAKKDEQ